MHPYLSDFFPFFLCKFPTGFHVYLADWRATNHVFIDSFQRKQLVPHGPSYGRKQPFDQWKLSAENQNRNKNISVSFLRFFTAHQQGFAS